MADKLSIEDLDLKDKRVLMRVDFNVPYKGDKIMSDQRIVAAVPTITYALTHGSFQHLSYQGAKSIVLMSHLGRPDGVPQPSMSLKIIVPRLQEILGR